MNANVLLVLPILIPLIAAALSLLPGVRRVARPLGVVAAAGLFAVALLLLHTVHHEGIQTTQLGGWPAPFGITLVADHLSAIMVGLAGMMGLTVAIYSLADIDERREAFGYYPLLNILLMGVCGAFLTGDIFNLYVWFEVLLIASFALLTLGGERAQIEGAIKYVTLNLLSSGLFLAAVGISYGATGTLNLADMARRLAELDQPAVVTTLSMLFLVAFGIKAAAFPLFFWLPASYHTPPVAVSAVFAALLTKVGVYSLLRVFTLLFVGEDLTRPVMLLIAGLGMITGVLGAVAQNEFRRILAFHSVSQIGYMLMGLALFKVVPSPETQVLALAGSIFFIVHHAIVKSTLFLVSGAAYQLCGTYELKKLGGLYRRAPGVAVLFLIPALSLAGIPPLSGFFAKFSLVQAGLQGEQYLLSGVALAVGLLTLFSMTKIWNEAFWKPAPPAASPPSPAGAANPADGESLSGRLRVMLVPTAFLAALAVVFGLWAEPVLSLSREAARELHNPAGYIEAVLEDS